MFNIVERSLSDELSKNEIASKTTLVLLVVAVFEILGGYINGKLNEKFNMIRLATVGTLLFELALGLSLYAYFLKSYVFCFFVGAAWGLSDCFMNAQVSVMASKMFDGEILIFSVYRFCLGINFILLGLSCVAAITVNLVFNHFGFEIY